MILFFDTETTGKVDFRAPPDAPHQPRLVQLGACLTDEAGKELGSLNSIIKPDGWTIPEEASGIHGITTETAIQSGIDSIAVLEMFRMMVKRAQTLVGHNIKFDLMVMRTAFDRAHAFDPFLKVDTFCTMLAMTPVCKLPGTYGDFKWPKLQEAYKHAFGEEFVGAHSAMDDVNACAKIYFWLKNGGKK